MLVTIPAHTRCSVAPDLPPPDDRRWRAHVTRRDVTGERIGGNSGAVVIRVEGWLILVREGADALRTTDRHSPAASPILPAGANHRTQYPRGLFSPEGIADRPHR